MVLSVDITMRLNPHMMSGLHARSILSLPVSFNSSTLNLAVPNVAVLSVDLASMLTVGLIQVLHGLDKMT
jgi:hypothetical protein